MCAVCCAISHVPAFAQSAKKAKKQQSTEPIIVDASDDDELCKTPVKAPAAAASTASAVRCQLCHFPTALAMLLLQGWVHCMLAKPYLPETVAMGTTSVLCFMSLSGNTAAGLYAYASCAHSAAFAALLTLSPSSLSRVAALAGLRS